MLKDVLYYIAIDPGEIQIERSEIWKISPRMWSWEKLYSTGIRQMMPLQNYEPPSCEGLRTWKQD